MNVDPRKRLTSTHRGAERGREGEREIEREGGESRDPVVISVPSRALTRTEWDGVSVGPAAPSRHTVCSYGFAGSERSREVNVRERRDTE